MAVSMNMGRDTKWLTLEVCREFQRGTCLRSDAECKFAHPSPSCLVENGRVIACFDSLKGRCVRDNCKYLHPPLHLKTQLEINGRNNLIQQKAAAAMLAQQIQFLFPGAQMPMTTFPVSPSLPTCPSLAVNPYLSQIAPCMGLMPELLPSAPLLFPGSPTGLSAISNGTSAQKQSRSDKLEVCREFQRGNCSRGEGDCRYAHPLEAGMVDCSENSVIVCMDFIKGRCGRDTCKYFHPPAHLQARIKATQHQNSPNTLCHQETWSQHSYADDTQLYISMSPDDTRPVDALFNRAPDADMKGFGMADSRYALSAGPLPKRPVLEKSDGSAATVFSPSMFHYHQALSNVQQPAFMPSVPMMHGSTVSSASTPVTNVSFAESAVSNQ